MNPKHTPGPWQVHSAASPAYSAYIVGDIEGPLDNNQMNYTPVCDVCDTPAFEANRALIVAAPEMLAALLAVAARAHRGTAVLDIEDMDMVRDAIKRATGSAA